MLKRLLAVKLFATFIMCALIIRIFYLQIIYGDHLAKAASSQRISQVDVTKRRGEILDRYGVTFTDRSTSTFCTLFPQAFKDMENELAKVCSILKINADDINRQFKNKNKPILIKADSDMITEIKNEDITNVSFVNILNRYDDTSLARHIVGYIKKNDDVGEAGIEKAYDKELNSNTKIKVGVVTDALFNTIKGYGYRVIGEDKNDKIYNVKTTLDFNIQKIVEHVMEEFRLSGAVVVENIQNGDILAMASKPDYDQNNIAQFLDNSNNALFNRAVASYNLGSIFKIIDVAAYLEHGGDTSVEYYCPGYAKIGDTEFRCSSYVSGGHGYQSLANGFANSCNTYFINLGINMGTTPMIEMAKRFGIGNFTGINKQGVNESAGRLPDFKNNLKDGNSANVSIGQGDVLATPLQVADLVATIANGGIKNKVNIIDSIVDSNFKKVKNIREDKAERILDRKIVDDIKSMMEQVTQNGTGTRASLSQYGGAAGKTGSAETGQMIGEKKVVHAWFAGYFPLNTPKYAISVFIEGGESGGKNAAPIFAQIAQEIMKKGL